MDFPSSLDALTQLPPDELSARLRRVVDPCPHEVHQDTMRLLAPHREQIGPALAAAAEAEDRTGM